MRSKLLCIIGTAIALVGMQAQAADIAAGESSYSSVCANCHGPTGKGMASFPALTGQDATYISTRLKQYRAGETVGFNSPLMIPNAVDLSDADIDNLAEFIATRLN